MTMSDKIHKKSDKMDIIMDLEGKIKTRKKNIEDILSSKGKVKILKVLAQMGELNISGIAKRSGLNHSTARQHLKFLEEAGIVQEKVFGRIRIYRYKSENFRARALKKLFDLWEA